MLSHKPSQECIGKTQRSDSPDNGVVPETFFSEIGSKIALLLLLVSVQCPT